MKQHKVTLHNPQRHKESGGISFVLKCCGEHEHSVMILQPGAYTKEELARQVEWHKAEASKRHESHLAAEEFLKSFEEPGGASTGGIPERPKGDCETC